MTRVLITGVSRGIGEGLLRQYLARGHHVHAMGRSCPDWAVAYGSALRFIPCDMADPIALEAACDAVAEPLDSIIVSAADFGADAYLLEQIDPAAFARTFQINCISPAMLASKLKPKLELGEGRKIVFMSTGNASLSGNTQGAMLAYRTSKSALNQLMRNIAAEWGASGFTAVALNPGWVRTAMGGENAPLTVEEASAAIYGFCQFTLSPALNGRFCNTDGSELPW